MRSYLVQGGRYDGYLVRIPAMDGRPPDAPVWIACWNPEVLTLAVHGGSGGEDTLPVAHAGSYSTHDERAEFAQHHSNPEAVYYLCKDGKVRSARFAAWAEEAMA